MFDNDFIALFPEIFLVNATICLLIYGVIFQPTFSNNFNQNIDSNKENTFNHSSFIINNIAWLGILSIFFTIVLLLNQPLMNYNSCYNNLILDKFTYFFKLGLCFSTGCIILMCLQYFQTKIFNVFEVIVLILMSTCSMLFLISAYDLITMYLAIELQSLCFYILAASFRKSEFSTEAGLKYFVLGAFSSGILLFGCSLIYGFTGNTNFEELAKIFTSTNTLNSEALFFSTNSESSFLNGAIQNLSDSHFLDNSNRSLFFTSGVLMGIIFIAVGFLFKISAVPFHMWAPDVYEGSPTYVTAFFSIVPKIALFAAMLRIFIYTFYDPAWQQLFIFCSIASMILGAFAALAQNKIKRLLAYSSIGHSGYLLIGLACGTIEGIQSLLIGLFVYVLMTISVFAIVLTLKTSKKNFQYISDLEGLAKTNPILALTLSLTMFSYAGIPPLAGFCSKFYLFFAALGSGIYLLAFIGIITSVISCFYYIRIVKIMYFDIPKKWIAYEPMDQEKSILLGIIFFFLSFFFLYPSPLFLIAHQMALSLCL
uniref:NADH dehydrogenase subunit 2 n=1 Tax=Roya anglica TaxID=43943 RepID=A0A6G9IEV1_9VIRI|nr:NADH dehydrogenase subunit 2 [Roya anglica]QIQ22992.1 NADH dehydrogenase subunit 2 [Roya anglica]